jgi:tRNA(Ile)-lysidine synthase
MNKNKVYIDHFMKKHNIFVLKRIARDVLKKGLFLYRDRILIAISGGQDSITCLFFIFLIKKQFKLTIGSSNCNHLFQTDSFYSSLNSLNQVYALEGKYSLSLCPYWLSTEKEARDWRHSVLQRTAYFNKFSSLCFGHTETDRLETLLFQLLRGSGIQGVHSIQWKKKRNNLTIEKRLFFSKVSFFESRKALHGNIFQHIKKKKLKRASSSKGFSKQSKNQHSFSYCRPLLGITRLETCFICNGWNIPSYSDNSNHSVRYTRNKVRNQVLPILRKILNARLEKTVCRFAEILSEENFYLNSILHRVENSVRRSEKEFTGFSSFGSYSSLYKEAWYLSGSSCLPLVPLFWLIPTKLKQAYEALVPNQVEKILEPFSNLNSNERKNFIHFHVNFFSIFGFFLDSLVVFRQAPLALKRRFLKKILEDFQMKKVTFQKVEILTNLLLNKKTRFFNQNFSKPRRLEWQSNSLFDVSGFFRSTRINEKLLLFRRKKNDFIFFQKNKRKKMRNCFSIFFIPGVGVLLLKEKEMKV